MKFEIIVSVDDEQKPGQLALQISKNGTCEQYPNLDTLVFQKVRFACSSLMHQLTTPQEQQNEEPKAGNDGTTDNDGNDGQDSDKTVND